MWASKLLVDMKHGDRFLPFLGLLVTMQLQSVALAAEPVRDDLPAVEDRDYPTSQTEVPDEEALENEADRELALSQLERREIYNRAVAIGVGVSLPWVGQHVDAMLRVGPGRFVSINGGTGRFAVSGDVGTNEERIETRARALGATVRQYVGERIPFYTRAGIQLLRWEGVHAPQGVGNAAIISSSYEGYGLVSSIDAGITYTWANGVYIENSLVGLGWASVLDLSATQEAAERDVRHHLRKLRVWGLFNIKVGCFF